MITPKATSLKPTLENGSTNLMASRRQHRVAELIHHEFSNILQFEIRDPRIGFATVTEVEVSPDLKVATIYVSLLTGDEAESLDGLEHAAPFARRELGRKLKLRYTPELRFQIDSSAAYAQKIDTLLKAVKSEE